MSQRLVRGLVVCAGLAPAACWAMPPADTLHVLVSQLAVGEQSDTQQADELLRQARKAMAESHLQLADSFISRAEALNPKYGPFHLGDTPAKVRADLNKKIGAPASPADSAAVHAGASGKSDKKAPPTDPFTVKHSGAPQAGAGNDRIAQAPQDAPQNINPLDANVRGEPSMMRLPPVDNAPAQALPSASKLGGYPSTGAPAATLRVREVTPGGDARSQSDSLLLGARMALAVGDVQRANGLLEQAKKLQVNYGATEDSPARVELLARKYAELTGPGRAGGKDSEGYRHQYAGLLMEQAEGLMRWREFDEAERLAAEAQRLPVQYNLIETRPDALLAKITEQRRQAQATSGDSRLDIVSSPAPGGGSRFDQPSNNGAPQQLPFATSRPTNKPLATELTRQARAALAAGDVRRAEQLAKQADGLAPDSAYNQQEDRPSLVILDIRRAQARNQGVVTAGAAVGDNGPRHVASQSIYDPANDPTKVTMAGEEELPPGVKPTPTDNPPALPTPPAGDSTLQPVTGPAQLTAPPSSVATPAPTRSGDGSTPAIEMFRAGERALTDGHREEALSLFRQAYELQQQLDPGTRQRLVDHLQMMSAAPAPSGENLLESNAARQQVISRKLAAEVSQQQNAAKAMQQKEPRKALDLLQKTRANVAGNNEVDPKTKQYLLRGVDNDILALQTYIQNNSAAIELNEKNEAVKKDVDDRRKHKVEVSEKLAQMVDEYNKLIGERRYAEAEVVAKRAAEMDPENPVVVVLVNTAKMHRRDAAEKQMLGEKEEGIIGALAEVDKAAVPMTGEPYQFGDVHHWNDVVRRRGPQDDRGRRKPGDIEIERKLGTPVAMKFKAAPLGEVVEYLRKVADVNIYLDPQGLQSEGITTDQPVTIDLTKDIQLKSALALILEPLHLSYVIKDEVLKITSEDRRRGELVTKSYPVADLVIPIPNFGPDGREGIGGALDIAYRRLGYGQPAGSATFSGAPTVMAVASDSGAKTNAVLNPAVAAQISKLVPSGGVHTGQPQTNPAGPGGQKGGNQADFDSLIDLITSTIATQTWTESGGSGSIAPFETNLTLVVSQTQEVHEQIADLLQQLRRLQDLQVTIEVRFITLNDNFFEQIGVNFNFNIPSATSGVTAIGSKHIPSQVIGIDPGGAVPATGSVAATAPPVQFRQGSFGAAAVPAFPGLTLDSTPTTFGFAILSDIEAFFLIQAFQGDSRSNVLQAPKVTLFNGQQAFVSDTSQRPFVTSVIPVVGDFAAAQQPVITVLSEGTSLTVQAVVSPDRRFVRLTVVPFFSQIGDVQEFQFTGSKTTTSNSANTKTGTDTSSNSAGSTVTTDGTTVQLPTFNFVTVTTTVSVPDGGTVLLGGIKRLSEGRNERGVPVLSKIPYLNRLFKNVGIGRTTSSLMMMVTPRIIIQEEEEAKLLGTPIGP